MFYGFLGTGQETLPINEVTGMSRDNVGLCFDAAITVQVRSTTIMKRTSLVTFGSSLQTYVFRATLIYLWCSPLLLLQVVDGTKAVPILGSRGGSSESETSSFSYAGFRENIIQKVGGGWVPVCFG